MKWFLAAAALLAVSSPAPAATVWTIERKSASVAVFTSSGTLQSFEPNLFGFYRIAFPGLSATTGDAGLDSLSGDLAVGTNAPTAGFVRANTTDVVFEFATFGSFSPGPVTGSATLALDVETYRPIGASGDVRDESGATLGTYQVVASGPAVVPLPAGAALLFGGLGTLAMLRRGRSARAKADRGRAGTSA
jgi:hypothetical protein